METSSPAVSLRLGNVNNGANDGLWARTLNDVATNARWNNGASLNIYQYSASTKMSLSVLHRWRLKYRYIRPLRVLVSGNDSGSGVASSRQSSKATRR